MGYWI